MLIDRRLLPAILPALLFATPFAAHGQTAPEPGSPVSPPLVLPTPIPTVTPAPPSTRAPEPAASPEASRSGRGRARTRSTGRRYRGRTPAPRAIASRRAPTAAGASEATGSAQSGPSSRVPALAPLPAATPDRAVVPVPARAADDGWWPWVAALVALALAGGWWMLRRRDRAVPDQDAREVESAALPAAEIVAPVSAAPIDAHHSAEDAGGPDLVESATPSTSAPAIPTSPLPTPSMLDRSKVDVPRAHLSFELYPTRAGTNLLSATVEGEMVVVNGGAAPARDIQIEVRLIGAHAGQEAELAAIEAQAINRPVTPPFSLAPGEERRLRVIAALPREAIPVMQAGGRAMFVPIVSARCHYRAAESVDGFTARTFAVGVERADSPKLAPFWLDTPSRMHQSVAARPHAATVQR